jgi:hypothetical protein
LPDNRDSKNNYAAMLALGFLPVLSSYQDAASFELAVLPFFHTALHHISEYKHGIDLYTHTNPFVSGSAFSMFASAFVFVASMVTGNWSWYAATPRPPLSDPAGLIACGESCP